MDPECTRSRRDLSDLLRPTWLRGQRGWDSQQFGSLTSGNRKLKTREEDADDNRKRH